MTEADKLALVMGEAGGVGAASTAAAAAMVAAPPAAVVEASDQVLRAAAELREAGVVKGWRWHSSLCSRIQDAR